jgi:NAD(P)-dependent dehydrogenase (short-subunit alcohol dehydrogenase family)
MEAAQCTLVTGASSGIGRATAVRLSADRKLILHGRNVERLNETREMCCRPGEQVLWSSDLKAVDKLADSLAPLLAASGLIVEAFVHCAGMVNVLPVRSINYPVVHETMCVNFFAAAEIVQLLLTKRVNGEKRLASVVFVSSIFSRFGARGHGAYCASKAALDGYMRALAVELAPAVRVNSVLPGAVRTAMSQEAFCNSEILAKLQHDYPMGIGETGDIADTIEYLLSSKAHWLTGQEIVVDGGRTVNMSLK